MASYKVNIPQPCAEPWEQMKPTGCGAFCVSCQKEVIDFTQKSYPEIAAILNNASGEVCGRFTKKQTEFEFEYVPLLSSTNWFRRGMIGAAFSLLVAAFTTNAQTPAVKTKTESIAKKKTSKLVFSGVVMEDSTNKPLSNVMVSLKQNPSYTTITDSLGRYELKIEKALISDSIFLFNKMTCNNMEVKLLPGIPQDVYLKPHVITLETIEITTTYPRNHEHEPVIVGALPSRTYTIRVVNQTNIPVDMMIRHFFGINYWD